MAHSNQYRTICTLGHCHYPWEGKVVVSKSGVYRVEDEIDDMGDVDFLS
jgi:hypothetical protein